ncbi:MAG: NAD(+) diphosphatase [Synergistes jonesii]|uniref:NAD(+) diphosphatase n=1 Tax=Synergistes jonesii TaxID=2754 RepID=UPI002430AAC3|nr:NAD(+) diphosphatase [Synergistes jonesii]MDY2985378.1 NAD(+) diphosphatase [Synergistes jonesii]
MSFCYIFQRGKVILLKNGTVPQSGEAAPLEKFFVNSGLVDKYGETRDSWGELREEAPLPRGFAAFERRGCWTAVGEEQFFRIGKAFHIMDWQRLHKYCGRCGAENAFDAEECAMRCTKCGELFYPVISPAIIVRVEKEGKILLGHGVNFPAGRYSVLAGFVEPGENLESCVRREVREESNISVKNVKYFASQPWPFPRSLMLGFTAEWESGEICPDKSEVTDVRWFAPDEIPDYYRGVSISARLIEDFVARQKK